METPTYINRDHLVRSEFINLATAPEFFRSKTGLFESLARMTHKQLLAMFHEVLEDPFVKAFFDNGFHVAIHPEDPHTVGVDEVVAQMEKDLRKVESHRFSADFEGSLDTMDTNVPLVKPYQNPVVAHVFTNHAAQTEALGRAFKSNRFQKERLRLLEHGPAMLVRANPLRNGKKGFPMAMITKAPDQFLSYRYINTQEESEAYDRGIPCRGSRNYVYALFC